MSHVSVQLNFFRSNNLWHFYYLFIIPKLKIASLRKTKLFNEWHFSIKQVVLNFLEDEKKKRKRYSLASNRLELQDKVAGLWKGLKIELSSRHLRNRLEWRCPWMAWFHSVHFSKTLNETPPRARKAGACRRPIYKFMARLRIRGVDLGRLYNTRALLFSLSPDPVCFVSSPPSFVSNFKTQVVNIYTPDHQFRCTHWCIRFSPHFFRFD